MSIRVRRPLEASGRKSEDLCVSLWRAVILQALTDATSIAVNATARKLCDDARNWLTTNSQDFQDACSLADIEPDQVRALALQKIAECPAPELKHRRSIGPRKPVTFDAKTYTVNGRSLTVKQWAEELNVPECTLRSRLRQGKPIEEVFSRHYATHRRGPRPSIATTKRYTVNGRTLSKSEWLILNDVTLHAFNARLRAGWTIERALSTPKHGGGGVKTFDEALSGPLSRVADDVKELEFQ